MTIQAFQSQIFPQGLQLNRCQINRKNGFWEAEVNAVFRQGQLVQLSANGLVQRANDGTDILGVASATKDTGNGNAVAVDEPVVLVGTTVTNLRRGAIVGTSTTNNSIKVALTAGGAALTVTTDYVVDSLANGQIHRAGGGAIPDGATVYVTYTYALTSADLDFQGRNFFNLQDDVTIQGSRIAVIQDYAILFTTEYDTSRRYQINDALTCGNSDAEVQGLVTNATEGQYVGQVIQIPTATDPWLGWEFRGQFTP